MKNLLFILIFLFVGTSFAIAQKDTTKVTKYNYKNPPKHKPVVIKNKGKYLKKGKKWPKGKRCNVTYWQVAFVNNLTKK